MPTTSAGDEQPASRPVVRRAPYASNPAVGGRGHRARQRILDAALVVLREAGLGGASVRLVAERAGTSRAAFYQYFSSKEDVLHALTEAAYGDLIVGLEELGPVDADHASADLQAWVKAFADNFQRYSAYYMVLRPADDADLDVTVRAWTNRLLETIRAGMSASTLPAAERRYAVDVLWRTAWSANQFATMFGAAGTAGPVDGERINDCLTQLFHRVLFPSGGRTGSSPVLTGATTVAATEQVSGGPIDPTREALVEAGLATFSERGFHATRVDDITDRAGLAHGTMYLHFASKTELFRVVGRRGAARFLSAFEALGGIDLAEPDADQVFAAWLRLYARTFAELSALIRVWADALVAVPELNEDSTDTMRTALQPVVGLLAQRRHGDAIGDAVVLLAALAAGELAPTRRRSIDKFARLLWYGFGLDR